MLCIQQLFENESTSFTLLDSFQLCLCCCIDWVLSFCFQAPFAPNLCTWRLRVCRTASSFRNYKTRSKTHATPTTSRTILPHLTPSARRTTPLLAVSCWRPDCLVWLATSGTTGTNSTSRYASLNQILCCAWLPKFGWFVLRLSLTGLMLLVLRAFVGQTSTQCLS